MPEQPPAPTFTRSTGEARPFFSAKAFTLLAAESVLGMLDTK